jgi:hypothetical protein
MVRKGLVNMARGIRPNTKPRRFQNRRACASFCSICVVLRAPELEGTAQTRFLVQNKRTESQVI